MKNKMNRTLPLTMVLLCLFCFTSMNSTIANNDNWANISSFSTSNKIVEADGWQFVATGGGLIAIEAASSDTSYFNRGNSPLPSNIIYDLIFDAEGTLWISTQKGTIRWNNGEWLTNGQTSKGYFASAFDTENSAVFMVSNDSLYLFDYAGNSEKWKVPHYQADLPRIVLDEENEILYIGLLNWFAESGVVAWQNNDWLTNEAGEFLFASNYYSALAMAIDEEQNLWVAGDSSYQINNAELIDTKAFDFTGFPNPVWMKNYEENIYMSFLVSQEELLFRLSNGNWLEINPDALDPEVASFLFAELPVFPGPYPLESIRILDIQIENEITYVNAGTQLFKIIDNEWEDLSLAANYPESTNGMVVTTNGQIWISYGANLYHYDSELNHWNQFDFPFDINQALEHLTSDKNGGLWMQTHSQLIHIVENSGFPDRFDTADHGYSSTAFQDIVCLENGEVWFSGFNGLLHFDGDNWTKFDDVDNASNFTFQMALDADNNLWFRQHSHLGVFLNGGFDYVEIPSQNGSTPYHAMKFDDNGDLWIAGSEELIRFRNGDFTNWTISNSCLADGSQNTIDFDDAGNIWLGSNWSGGISIFNPDGIQDPILDGVESVSRAFANVLLYPNPVTANNQLKISSGLNAHVLPICVYDLQGRSIRFLKKQLSEQNEWIIDLPSLPQGQYFLRMASNIDSLSIPFMVE